MIIVFEFQVFSKNLVCAQPCAGNSERRNNNQPSNYSSPSKNVKTNTKCLNNTK